MALEDLDCRVVTLSPINAELWAACCPKETSYGIGEQKTWSSKGVQYPCTKELFLGPTVPQELGWSNRQVAVTFALLTFLLVGTALLAWRCYKRWGTTLSIHYHYLVTRIQLLYHGIRMRGIQRGGNQSAAPGGKVDAEFVVVNVPEPQGAVASPAEIAESGGTAADTEEIR